MVRIERDIWIMLVALSPQSAPEWVAQKNAALDDPQFQRLYLTCDQAMDWDPDDPRLSPLATDIAAWDSHRSEPGQAQPATVTLMYSYVTTSSPAWQRLMTLLSAPLPGLVSPALPEPRNGFRGRGLR